MALRRREVAHVLLHLPQGNSSRRDEEGWGRVEPLGAWFRTKSRSEGLTPRKRAQIPPQAAPGERLTLAGTAISHAEPDAHPPGCRLVRQSQLCANLGTGGAGRGESLASVVSVLRQRSQCSRVTIHSITSSAPTSTLCGTVRPSALAAFRLTTSSSLVDCSNGISPGFVPLRILSMKLAERRDIAVKSPW